jgi:UPF0716 family protein affecting phage T7 exclusion
MEVGILWVLLIGVAAFVLGFFMSRANGTGTDLGNLADKVDGKYDRVEEKIEDLKEKVEKLIEKLK